QAALEPLEIVGMLRPSKHQRPEESERCAGLHIGALRRRKARAELLETLDPRVKSAKTGDVGPDVEQGIGALRGNAEIGALRIARGQMELERPLELDMRSRR